MALVTLRDVLYAWRTTTHFGHLDTWFHPSSTDGAKRCNIINFDFIGNARIVSHCKNVTIEKAVEKAKLIQPTNYEIPPTPQPLNNLHSNKHWLIKRHPL